MERGLVINDALEQLADPEYFCGSVDLQNRTTPSSLLMLEKMVRIRMTEEVIADLIRSGEAVCPCHLAIGQEAVPVAVAVHLTPDDHSFGAHRSHGQFLALGGSVEALLAEVLGKESGCSKGMGGSMHLYDPTHGFRGSVPIVAGTVPLAAGAALAAKMEGRGGVAVAFFGDGACEEGVVHETLNLAAVMKLPLLFVVENNLFSSHLDIHLRQPSNSVARFAKAHHVASEVVDGNDVGAIGAAAEALITRARNGDGPGFLEAVTYRWRGHVGPEEDVDVGVRRSMDELVRWKMRDPIRRLSEALSLRGVEAKELEAISASCREEIQRALSAARAAPYPEDASLLDRVYRRGPA